MREIASLIIITVCALGITACGKSDRSEDSAPPPGAMRVVSVEPIEAPPAPSILPNGDFRDWPEDAPAPTNFRAPNPDLSAITRQPISQEQGGGFEVLQTWKQTDFRNPWNRRFGGFADVKPQTKYRVEVKASSPDDSHAEIIVYEVDPKGDTTLLVNGLIQIAATAKMYTYTGEFQTKDNPRVFIESGHPNKAKLPSNILWHEWDLRPLED